MAARMAIGKIGQVALGENRYDLTRFPFDFFIFSPVIRPELYNSRHGGVFHGISSTITRA